MKQYAILALALMLCCAMLVGCGCMNTGSNVPTLPTNGESSTPTTRATTAPTTAPATQSTTMPETEATADSTMGDTTESTGAAEGPMDSMTGSAAEDSTGQSDAARGRARGMMPRG